MRAESTKTARSALARWMHEGAKMRFALSPFLTIAYLLSASGCSCDDCRPETEIWLPTLEPTVNQSVTITFRREKTSNVITCTWGADSVASVASWHCSPDPKSMTYHPGAAPSSTEFDYPLKDAKSAWIVDVQGPSGATTVTLTPSSNDPGEGWPTECICYGYAVRVQSDTLVAVGATLEK